LTHGIQVKYSYNVPHSCCDDAAIKNPPQRSHTTATDAVTD